MDLILRVVWSLDNWCRCHGGTVRDQEERGLCCMVDMQEIAPGIWTELFSFFFKVTKVEKLSVRRHLAMISMGWAAYLQM